jgi:hypothetical protein
MAGMPGGMGGMGLDALLQNPQFMAALTALVQQNPLTNTPPPPPAVAARMGQQGQGPGGDPLQMVSQILGVPAEVIMNALRQMQTQGLGGHPNVGVNNPAQVPMQQGMMQPLATPPPGGGLARAYNANYGKR